MGFEPTITDLQSVALVHLATPPGDSAIEGRANRNETRRSHGTPLIARLGGAVNRAETAIDVETALHSQNAEPFDCDAVSFLLSRSHFLAAMAA